MSCSDTDHRHARCPFRFRRRSSATRSTFITQHRYTVTSHAVTRYRRHVMRYFVVGPVAGLDQTARIMVQPVGRARRAPHHDLLLDRHDFDGLVGQNNQRVVQTRRIHQNLVIADPFEDQGDLLGGWMDDV